MKTKATKKATREVSPERTCRGELRELLAAMDAHSTTQVDVCFGKAGTDDIDAAQARLGKAIEAAREALEVT